MVIASGVWLLSWLCLIAIKPNVASLNRNLIMKQCELQLELCQHK
jgi:hypothetical protein